MRSSLMLQSLTQKKESDRSFLQSVPLSIRNVLMETYKLIPIGLSPMTELDIKWSSQQDLAQIKYILQELLEYPSTDLADIHRDSNRLGLLDVLENKGILNEIIEKEEQPQIYCPCCGFLLQKSQISMSTPLNNISNMGISTHLYFKTLINLSSLLIVLFLIYGIFSLATNIISFSQNNQKLLLSSNQNFNFLITSLSSKQLNKNYENMQYYLTQCWLGLAVVIIWCGMFLFMKYIEENNKHQIQDQTKSASDFSVLIQGIPPNMSKQHLQQQLDSYYQAYLQKNKHKQLNRPFTISKFNVAIPFYLSMDTFAEKQLKNLIQQKNGLNQKFVSWIFQRKQSTAFKTPENQRTECYKKYEQLKKQIKRQYKLTVNRILKQKQSQTNQYPTTSAYVTFQSNYAKQLLCKLNTTDNMIFGIDNLFTYFRSHQLLRLNFQDKIFQPVIKRAPEPQDIIWTNVGQSLKQGVYRKIITYSFTVILLGISFVFTFYLSDIQYKNSEDYLISFAISFCITIMNLLITVILRILTGLERSETQTKFQTNLAIKSIIAQLINSIVLPFLINYLIQHNVYYVDGLAYDIFTLAVTNCFLVPALKIINLDYLVTKIKSWHYKKSQNKLSLNQEQLNQMNSLLPFEAGSQYIYPVNIFLFTCFFVSLQPIICIFALIGLIMMYWIQKYTLLYRTRRPFPGNDLINTTMYKLICFGPLVFSLGNLTWSNLLPDGGPDQSLIPNVISIILSSIFALLPHQLIISKWMAITVDQQLLYSENRIYLPSQYDRLNPSTAKEAIQQYYNFLKSYKFQIKQASTQKLKIVQSILSNQRQRGKKDIADILKPFVSFQLKYMEKQNKQEHKQEQRNNDLFSMFCFLSTNQHNIQLFPQSKSDSISVTSQQMFRHLQFGQQNGLQFIQNWIPSILQKQSARELTIIQNAQNKQKKEQIIYQNQCKPRLIGNNNPLNFITTAYQQNKLKKMLTNRQILKQNQTNQENQKPNNLTYVWLKQILSRYCHERKGKQTSLKQRSSPSNIHNLQIKKVQNNDSEISEVKLQTNQIKPNINKNISFLDFIKLDAIRQSNL